MDRYDLVAVLDRAAGKRVTTAVRTTSIAAARSRGPKTPGPASCIAP
jgi:hypothetical protein